MDDVYALLQLFLQIMASSLKVERISIVTPNGDGTISPKTGLGLSISAYDPTPWETKRVSAFVMETRSPLLVRDLNAETRFDLNRVGYKSSSFISAPIIIGDEVWGVINLTDKKGGTPLNEDDLNSLLQQIPILIELIKRIELLGRPLKGESINLETRLVGESEEISKVRRLIVTLADTDLTVFVKGETGTGKSFVAELLHDCSGRRAKPFIKVNCAALPETLLEAELFGYERGAFTGAFEKKPGKFEIANRGTILLDEISELEVKLQAKLLQVIEDKEYPRVGGKENIKVDVRIVATSNLDLAVALAEGRFRRDLFYRLNEVSIFIPPLRERREDIPALVRHFLQLYNRKYKRQTEFPSDKTLNAMMDHSWPGNIRELETMVKRYVIFEDESVLLKFDAEPAHNIVHPMEIDPEEGLLAIGRKAAATAEREALLKTLEKTHWNKSKAAKILKVSYKTLLEKIKTYGLEREDDEA